MSHAPLKRFFSLCLGKFVYSSQKNHIHLAAFTKDTAIGCLVLVPLENAELKMRQVAVAPFFQGKRIGQKLVKASEKYAQENGFNKMTLHARENAVPFYTKLNYKIIGECFVEVSISHFEMMKNIQKD
ncbi:MAG: GNAT family N-acetyltransferase [Alphaproteobacteria bacterium]